MWLSKSVSNLQARTEPVWYIVVAILAQSTSLLLAKNASIGATGINRYLSIWYLGSLTALGVQAIVWQQALKRYPLSFAYPFMSAVFLIIPVVSVVVFDESLSAGQVVGAVLIAAGTVQLTRCIPDQTETKLKKDLP